MMRDECRVSSKRVTRVGKLTEANEENGEWKNGTLEEWKAGTITDEAGPVRRFSTIPIFQHPKRPLFPLLPSVRKCRVRREPGVGFQVSVRRATDT